MTDEKLKRRQGRPVENVMPDPIPDTPPKKDDEWEYTKAVAK